MPKARRDAMLHPGPDFIRITTGRNPEDYEAVLRALRQAGIHPNKIANPTGWWSPVITLSFDPKVSRRQAIYVVEAALLNEGIRSIRPPKKHKL